MSTIVRALNPPKQVAESQVSAVAVPVVTATARTRSAFDIMMAKSPLVDYSCSVVYTELIPKQRCDRNQTNFSAHEQRTKAKRKTKTKTASTKRPERKARKHLSTSVIVGGYKTRRRGARDATHNNRSRPNEPSVRRRLQVYIPFRPWTTLCGVCGSPVTTTEVCASIQRQPVMPQGILFCSLGCRAPSPRLHRCNSVASSTHVAPQWQR